MSLIYRLQDGPCARTGRPVDKSRAVILGVVSRVHEVHGRLGRLGRGCPSLTEAGEASPEIEAKVPSELKTRIRQETERQRKSVSVFIREALERHIDEGR